MLKNIFMAQLGFELMTSATPPSTALSVTSTDCAIETTPKKIVLYIYIYMYIYMTSFGEYTSNRHNISVALDPHGMLK